MEYCKKETFFTNATEDIVFVEEQFLLCLTEQSKDKANIFGCPFCSEMQRMEVRLMPCDSTKLAEGETCGDREYLDIWLDDHELVISRMTNFIDFDDIEQPVHSVLENRFMQLDVDDFAQITFIEHVHELSKMDKWV